MNHPQWPAQPPQAPPPAYSTQLQMHSNYSSNYVYCQTIPNQLQYLNPSSDDLSVAAAPILLQSSITAYDSFSNVQTGCGDVYQTVDAAGSYHNSDPIAHGWALKEAIRVYGTDPSTQAGQGIPMPTIGTHRLSIAYPSSILANQQVSQPQGRNTWKKHPKRTKFVQSAYCEICKVDCNSMNVLDQHKLGRRHQKNLEKLQCNAAIRQSSSASSNVQTAAASEKPDDGKPTKGRKNSRRLSQPTEDMETKRRKLVEGGASLESVRTCVVCNVVCNSEIVYNFHLAGQKHSAMVKKHASQTGIARTTGI